MFGRLKVYSMINHKNGFKIVLISIITLLCLLLSSCARTVSNKSTFLDLELIISTVNPISFTNTSFYIVFSKSNTINLPEIGTSLNEYLPTPGQNYDEGILIGEISPRNTLSYFYNNYYSSWNNYIIIGQNNTLLYQGNEDNGFTINENGNEELQHNSFRETVKDSSSGFSPDLSINDKTFSISFAQSSLSTYFKQNSNIYIAIFNVDTSISTIKESGRIQDIVIVNDPISLRSNEEVIKSNLEGNINNNNFDISSITIKVF